ncbi:MAG: hypothetical protein MUP80_10430, partial [Acidobacteriia bacterium]|nr:hypothetical protein [Terriglobia bacterium]
MILYHQVLSAPAEEEEGGWEGNLPSSHERWRARGDLGHHYREGSKSGRSCPTAIRVSSGESVTPGEPTAIIEIDYG